MPTPIKRGNDDPQRQQQQWTFEWARGGSYSEVWKGINPDKMLAKYNGMAFSAQRMNMTIEKGISELRVEWGADATGGNSTGSLEVTVDRWECPEPKVLKPVFSHPSYIYGIDLFLGVSLKSATPENISTVLAILQQSVSSKAKWVDVARQLNTLAGWPANSWNTFLGAQPTTAAYMIRVYNLALNGQSHFQYSIYACRHTTNAPAYWSRNVADFNVNCILTPAQFLSEVTNSFYWYFPMPARLQYKLSLASSNLINSIPTRANYLIGWLKGPSGEATTGRGRIEISTTYELDQWSTDLYGTV